MNRRRALIALLGSVGIGTALTAYAQRRPARIGYLVQSPIIDPPSAERAAFLDELRKLGWEVGRNLQIEYRSSENEPEFLADLAKELVQLDVDLIVAASESAATAAKAASRRIPIVFTQSPDPVGSGLVQSLARPGGNTTGLSYVSPDLAGKRLQMLREIVPRARRVAVIWASYATKGLKAEIGNTVDAAGKIGLRVDAQSIDSAEALTRWFERAARNPPDALLVLADLKMVSYRDILVQHSGRLRIPLIAGWPDVVHAGALISYSATFADLFRRSAHFVDMILKGRKPGDIPVEQPTKFELVINMRTAKALGLKIPLSLLLRADQVIE